MKILKLEQIKKWLDGKDPNELIDINDRRD